MSARMTPGTVLIVDDDETIIDFVSMALGDEGYECFGAEDGLEATRQIEQRKPALILLDLSMPKMDGAEVIQWMRANGWSNIPTIIMTAGQHAARRGEELGVSDYLAKPFDLAQLRNKIKKWSEPKTT